MKILQIDNIYISLAWMFTLHPLVVGFIIHAFRHSPINMSRERTFNQHERLVLERNELQNRNLG
jgi:hypothetical protein